MNKSGFGLLAIVLASMTLGACDMGGMGGMGGGGMGGHGMGGDGTGGGVSQTTGATTSTGEAASSTTSTGGGEAPAAPMLDDVAPLHMALHVYWTNVADDCDEIEGERSTPEDDFALIFTVPGTVDNEADDAATDSAVTYTYRVRCRRGEVYSEYSNELSASPT